MRIKRRKAKNLEATPAWVRPRSARQSMGSSRRRAIGRVCVTPEVGRIVVVVDSRGAGVCE